jgi:hypothetical protein
MLIRLLLLSLLGFIVVYGNSSLEEDISLDINTSSLHRNLDDSIGPIAIYEVWMGGGCSGKQNTIDALVTNVCIAADNGQGSLSKMYIWEPIESKFGTNIYADSNCQMFNDFIDYGLPISACTSTTNNEGAAISFIASTVSSPQELFQKYSTSSFLVEVGYGQSSCMGSPTTFSIVFYDGCLALDDGQGNPTGEYGIYQFSVSGLDVSVYSDNTCTGEVSKHYILSNQDVGLNNCDINTGEPDKISKIVTTSYYYLSYLSSSTTVVPYANPTCNHHHLQ